MCNTLVAMTISGGTCGYKFQYGENHRWVTALYRLHGGSFFMDFTSNVFVTPELGLKRCMRFVSATGVSRGSYSNISEFLVNCIGL
jgi:hypothetical protein